MSFGEELRQADEQRLNAIFDDIWASTDSPAAESEVGEFIDAEMELALRNYGILQAIHERIDEIIPMMKEQGISNDTLSGILTGSNIVIMALASYADSQAPDKPDET